MHVKAGDPGDLAVHCKERRVAVDGQPVPHHAAGDAVRIVVASCQAIDYLLSRTFRHVANAAMNPRIARVWRQEGYVLPFMCSPTQLMERRRFNAHG